MSSNSGTRVHARLVDSESPPKRRDFAVVEPTLRTTLFSARPASEPARAPAEPARAPAEPARAPAEPARAPSEARARFSAGGTQILPGRPRLQPALPTDSAQTQHFAVEELLSRRAGLSRQREQQLNRELELELALLAPDADAGPALESPPVRDEPVAIKSKKLWLRVAMGALLFGSVAMLSYEPAPEPASPEPSTPASSAQPAELKKPTRAVPAPLPAASIEAHGTLQRAAADVVAEGRYAEALALYRRLAESDPTNPAYPEVVEILEHRLATPTSAGPAPR